jgi:hypothetical protein
MLATEERSTTASRCIEFDGDLVRRKLNREWFAVEHHLSSHPLFSLPRLVELAKTTAVQRPQFLHFDVGAKSVSQRWDETPSSQWPVDETIRRVQDAGAWIVIRRANEDPDYGRLLNQCMDELLEHADPELERKIKIRECIVFITSPNRLSTYHIDRECNFLLQISGEKMLYVFDQNDREVLPQTEIERFWSVDHNAAVYKPEYQDRAYPFLLKPGNGLHIPINCPHWLQNGNNISISLSVNFQFRESVAGNLHRANYFLRRLGITPSAPGQSSVRDALKTSIFTGIKGAIDATPDGMKDVVKRVMR